MKVNMDTDKIKSTRIFEYSNEEVEKMFKKDNSPKNYENTPILRPLTEDDKFPTVLLDSYYDSI